MIMSIDFLTLVLAGACVFYVGVDSLQSGDRIIDLIGFACVLVGVLFFVVGATGAFADVMGMVKT